MGETTYFETSLVATAAVAFCFLRWEKTGFGTVSAATDANALRGFTASAIGTVVALVVGTSIVGRVSSLADFCL
jgi:hypothetical protein